MVLCQDLTQIRMRNFSGYWCLGQNPVYYPAASILLLKQPPSLFRRVAQIGPETYSRNGYGCGWYCKRLQCIRRPVSMRVYSLWFWIGSAIPAWSGHGRTRCRRCYMDSLYDCSLTGTFRLLHGRQWKRTDFRDRYEESAEDPCPFWRLPC